MSSGPPIKKSSGVTPTERLLADYCDSSFLRLWSYPNPYKDDGHELCDVLAVFENHVFIFFDRRAPLELDDDDAKFAVSWERWRRKVIDAQIRAAHGAERYIRSGRQVFLDGKGTTPFPLSLAPEKAIVHKIIVAHGASEACKAYSAENVYGSLAICYEAEGDSAPEVPFILSIDRRQPVHVLDGHNLEIVFRELDTFFDLSSYLDEKIDAIARHEHLSYCGEEDLLAHYFLQLDKTTKRHFIGIKDRKLDGVHIGEGEWKDFVELEVYKAKKKADQVSYLWDEIIQRTCQNALDGTLLGDANLLRGQSAIHEMAKEPRFTRRAFSRKMYQAVADFPDAPGLVRHVCFFPSYYSGKGYVFLQLKAPDAIRSEPDYRDKRRKVLEIACGAAKNRLPELKQVVGIGIDAAKFVDTNAEDFVLMRCDPWTEERRRYYETLNEGFKFFQTGNLRQYHQHVTEFPSAERPKGKVGRNELCPCGSGKKYKKCCGRE